MILLGLGGNLPHMKFGAPQNTLTVALKTLTARGARPVRRSRWYRTAPMPDLGQPWYINAVAELETTLEPTGLLALLLAVEAELGRVRTVRNASRTLDLDLLAYHDHIQSDEVTPRRLAVPHPRLHERAFVLLPLAEIAPAWRHPVSGTTVPELIAALPPVQVAQVKPVDGTDGP